MARTKKQSTEAAVREVRLVLRRMSRMAFSAESFWGMGPTILSESRTVSSFFPRFGPNSADDEQLAAKLG